MALACITPLFRLMTGDFLRPCLNHTLFRLMLGDFLWHCLNHTRIPTHPWGFPIDLSESHPHSDSCLEISYSLVRITPLFRLILSGFLWLCLNHTRIRTHAWKFPFALSESHHFSDSCLEISYRLVRITPLFRLILGDFLLPCLNHTLIQTHA